MDENVPGLVRLNDRIHPTTRGAVADVGLLFVIFFNGGAKLLEFFWRRFLVALSRASKNCKDGVRCLGGSHHGIASCRPRDNKSRIVCLSAHRVIPCTK